MNRGILILAIVLIAFGGVGLMATNTWQSTSFYANTALPGGAYGMTLAPHPFGSAGVGPGMMDSGNSMLNAMMGNNMMGMHGASVAPNVNATPVPSNQPIDREVKIFARNSQFDSVRIVVKQGETIQFAFTNQDSYSHNLGRTDARIPFIPLPANGTASTTWVAAQKGTFRALCTFHPGMQMQIVVE